MHTDTDIVQRFSELCPSYYGVFGLLQHWADQTGSVAKAKAAAESTEALWLESAGTKDMRSDTLLAFERITGIGKQYFLQKFYRDHLNHALRVALLMPVIGNSLGLNISSDLLVACGLLHDCGYPVEGLRSMTAALARAEELYACIDTAQIGLSLRMDTTLKTIALLLGDGVMIDSHPLSASHLAGPMTKRHHALMGAIQARESLRKADFPLSDVKSVVCAIAYHHLDSVPARVTLRDNPLAVTLILADEIQEWGRMSADGVGVDIRTKINCSSPASIVITQDLIHTGRVFSSLHAKQRNLSRVDLEGSACTVRFVFPLPRPREVDLAAIHDFMVHHITNVPHLRTILMNHADGNMWMDGPHSNVSVAIYDGCCELVEMCDGPIDAEAKVTLEPDGGCKLEPSSLPGPIADSEKDLTAKTLIDFLEWLSTTCGPAVFNDLSEGVSVTDLKSLIRIASP